MKHTSNQVSLEPYGYKLIQAAPDKKATGMEQKTRFRLTHNQQMWFAIAVVIVAVGYMYVAFPSTLKSTGSSPANNDPVYVARRQAVAKNAARVDSVHLAAKSWNEGKVHMWHGLGGYGSDSTFTDVSESASCRRLDNKTYQIQDGGPPIYYYKLACNGSVGYVEVDQIR